MTGHTNAGRSVHRRHVFFVSGFDPKGASYYHALHAAEAAKQDAVTGTSTSVGQRVRDAQGNSHWTISSKPAQGSPTGHTETTFEFARWDDIVRKHWPRSAWRLLVDLVFAYNLIIRSGGIVTTWHLSRKTLVGLAYPLVVIGGCLGLAAAISLWASAALIGSGTPWPVATAVGLGLMALGLWATDKLEAKLNSTWLVRIFSFTGRHACGQLPELDARLNTLAEKIADKLGRQGVYSVDEVLVVGFSVGSILSVSGVARALAQPGHSDRQPPPARPVLSLMTLGHCIPMLGLLPQAAGFRGELKTLAAESALRWIDFSSLTDWGSFAMVDPVQACRITLPGGQKHNPTMRSPRFHTQFAAATYDKLKRNKRRIHMQYLMASELPSEYDYFAITAGSVSLDERYPRADLTRPAS